MKKRLFRLLLCLCMALTLLPATALAATKISIIRITVDKPATGKIPAVTATLPSSAHSVVEKVEWSGALDTDGTFMPRTSYTVIFTMGIKQGSGRIFSDKSIKATVNGKEADDVLWYADDMVKVIYTFPQFGTGSILTIANITLEAPAVGAKPAVTAKLPSTASTYVKNLVWTGALDSSGRFQAGTEYTAVITLGVKDGLNRSFSKTTFDATVNGVLIDAATLTRVSDKELIIPVAFERLEGYAPAQTAVLEEAYLTIAAPAAGETPANTAQARSGDGCYVKDVRWTGALDGGRFQGGVEYTAIITLEIPSLSSAKFSDSVFDAVVNGVVIDAATLTRVSDKELIVPVVFEKTAAPATGFNDVPADAYFAAPVAWAVEREITGGTGNGAFSPDQICTQAQILTFLWRAKGSPEPAGTVAPEGFDGTEYYYKAALWAAEQGLIGGEFDPEAPCTRAMAVTYMWKQAGSPAAAPASFSDVPAGAEAGQAVAWAVEKGVTGGVGDNKFAPGQSCTRGQIVTFLYRAFAS